MLTPVGTLPAALIGIDVKGLLSGAAEMAKRCDTADLLKNPAGVYAMLQWLADTQLKKTIAVFMPYSDPLRDFAAWFVQLWAESLGKKKSDGTSVGSTPLAALGATDQHAQVQLFMEGPADKTVTFVAVKDRRVDVAIPAGFPDVKELGYLTGHSLGELIDIEQRATAGALARRGRPNMTIHLNGLRGSALRNRCIQSAGRRAREAIRLRTARAAGRGRGQKRVGVAAQERFSLECLTIKGRLKTAGGERGAERQPAASSCTEDYLLGAVSGAARGCEPFHGRLPAGSGERSSW